jgi:hypothetical protein
MASLTTDIGAVAQAISAGLKLAQERFEALNTPAMKANYLALLDQGIRDAAQQAFDAANVAQTQEELAP